jgi:hypothetical protein
MAFVVMRSSVLGIKGKKEMSGTEGGRIVPHLWIVDLGFLIYDYENLPPPGIQMSSL